MSASLRLAVLATITLSCIAPAEAQTSGTTGSSSSSGTATERRSQTRQGAAQQSQSSTRTTREGTATPTDAGTRSTTTVTTTPNASATAATSPRASTTTPGTRQLAAGTQITLGDSSDLLSAGQTGSSVLGRLDSGTGVTVLETSGDFVRVQTPTGEGWVLASALQSGRPASLVDRTFTLGTETSFGRNPGEGNLSAGSFTGGSDVTVIDQRGEWVEVRDSSGRTGWVREDSLPVMNGPSGLNATTASTVVAQPATTTIAADGTTTTTTSDDTTATDGGVISITDNTAAAQSSIASTGSATITTADGRVITMNSGTGTLNSGSSTLNTGSATTNAGSATLNRGTATTNTGSATLNRGSATTNVGSDTLNRGSATTNVGSTTSSARAAATDTTGSAAISTRTGSGTAGTTGTTTTTQPVVGTLPSGTVGVRTAGTTGTSATAGTGSTLATTGSTTSGMTNTTIAGRIGTQVQLNSATALLTQPIENGSQAGQLTLGTPVTILAQQGDFIQVSTSTGTGWVRASALDFTTDTSRGLGGGITGQATLASAVRLSNAPGQGSDAGTLLNAGTQVAILEQRGQWVRVRNDAGTEGWVRTDAIGGLLNGSTPGTNRDRFTSGTQATVSAAGTLLSQPVGGSTTIGPVVAGSTVTVLDQRGDYVRVRTSAGAEGWVLRSSLGVTTPSNATDPGTARLNDD